MDKWTEYDEMEYQKKKNELLLCIFLGWLGGHKFYQRKIGLGIVYLLTMGLFCIAWVVDIIKIAKEYKEMGIKKQGGTEKTIIDRTVDVDVEKIVLSNGRNRINAIKEYREKTGADLKTAMEVIDNTYDSVGINLLKKVCPKCGSENCHAFVEDKVIRQGKTKTQTSFNLNPLKPFTVFNTKEKVVREPLTMKVSKFVCDDCGKIFN